MADTRTKTKKGSKPMAKKQAPKTKGAVNRSNKVTEAKEASEVKEGSDDEDDSDDKNEYEDTDFSDLIKQVKTEYKQGYDFILPKWQEWALRLKLYNNQKRDKNAVGDTMLFTIFQTVLASLYSDTLIASFTPRENGDDEAAENLDMTAEFDHDEMEKDILDYEWDFEAMFFGRSLMMVMEFDRENMVPVPELWNVMTTIRDPFATSVNGDKKRRGAARFLGREIRLTKNELEEADVYFNYKDLKPTTTSTRSLVDENMRITAEAAGLSDISKFTNVSGENASHRLLEWFTIHKGKRVFVTLADDMKKVIRYEVLEDMDIPIVDRVIYPIPNSWDGVSVTDLIEDKQRARAVLTNLGLKSVKTSLHPMYLFDETRIKNRNDLNFEFNKFIGVQGNVTGAVQPMQRDQIKQDVDYIMNTLAQGGELSTASPTLQQGGQPDQRNTATRDALINQKVDTRYSLSAKVFGWSERRFWKRWYKLYKDHFEDDIDEKTVRITGALGAQFRPFTRENLITSTDPDVKIESKTLSEARRFNELQAFRAYYQFIATDPEANLRFGLRYMAKLQGLKKDVIEHLLPPTIEEMRAEEENIAMRENPKEPVEVLPTDDHRAHLEIHNKMEDTPAKIAHINAHKKAMMLQKARPDLFPQAQQQDNGGVKDENIAPAGSSNPSPVSEGGGRPLPVA